MTGFSHDNISRRSFLKGSLCTAGGCFLPSLLFAKAEKMKEDTKSSANYYLLHREQMLKDFNDTNEGADQWLTSKYGEKIARTITRDAREKFNNLLPLLPDVGGDRNIMIEEISIVAWYVAYYHPMKSHGVSAEEVGRMIYDLYSVSLQQIPEAKALADGAEKFTSEYITRIKKWAAWTRKKEYPANWVVAFVSGEGRDFDYGYDYTECALVKYLKAHGAGEVAPYVCLTDFIRSRTYGTGLRRSKTLAQGDNVCNFRYKKSRTVIQDWKTEIEIIIERQVAIS
jgi:L-2-amino-thiazoline-4-carboxylic acid hydrolase-like protein